MTTKLPPYISRELVLARLQRIFPEGLPNRNYLVRDLAGATVFAMLYVGAVEGSGRYVAPKHVYRMGDEQAAMASDAARVEYGSEVQAPGFVPRGQSWYADNTREPIRDETLRQGLVAVGAAVVRQDVPTTSPVPRHALAAHFVALFNPALQGEELERTIQDWRSKHLSKAALTKIALTQAGVGGSTTDVPVQFPNNAVRHLSPGPSSVIAKAVVEEFAPRFLNKPSVLWMSESAKKVVAQDDLLARKIGININQQKNLPDIILVDLGDPTLLVFAEVVATDGPVTETRRAELLALATSAGFIEADVAFVTAFLSRSVPAFRKALESVAWNSFVWVATEPGSLIAMVGAAEPPMKLNALLSLGSYKS
ncbi:BsuBI/PstI family type II restriction endonuclease [Myxococcus sp. MxC21-1]|uniref:BsuBI/PstI family type II restriction endonuclease n=1 Tax=Myxococcus sp. MxC21-1 TaxID=3041439 RepID=UPI00292EAF5E|nr:BsuBI/PstI family type II restriction endonuclease [Myxococcus sp. MxC21-1]WNZ59103.1 BsuBI/PstI family type II restriction endonuclease [Myxococcus sp. MxC21-1]